jgi:hypothetical protein
MVAHLYRIGAWRGQDVTPESLWEELPRFSKAALEEPLFRSVKGGGHGLRTKEDCVAQVDGMPIVDDEVDDEEDDTAAIAAQADSTRLDRHPKIVNRYYITLHWSPISRGPIHLSSTRSVEPRPRHVLNPTDLVFGFLQGPARQQRRRRR